MKSSNNNDRNSCTLCKRDNRDILLLPCCHSCCVDCFLLWSTGAKLEKSSAYYSSIESFGNSKNIDLKKLMKFTHVKTFLYVYRRVIFIFIVIINSYFIMYHRYHRAKTFLSHRELRPLFSTKLGNESKYSFAEHFLH